MKAPVHHTLTQIKFLLAFSFLFFGANQLTQAQCIGTALFGGGIAPTGGGSVTLTTCMFGGEYNEVTGVAATTNYQSTGLAGEYITVTQGAPGGPVVGAGFTPLNWTSTVAGTYYIHFHLSGPPGCGTDASCHTSTLIHTGGGGGGFNPCASITNIGGCGQSINANMSGTGVPWNINACGFATPGTEMIFSYTPTTSGVHSIDVTSATGGFVDFFWKDASLGCNNTGWNCISDISLTGNYGSMNWTAGTTYYILLDPEGTGAYSFTFDLNCPNPGGGVTSSDCPSAIPVCTDLNFAIDPNGFGLVDELCMSCVANPGINPASANMGCLLSGELNSSWFLINVFSGGTLEFSFGNPVVLGNCYDWIMWPYGPTTCSDIVNNTQAPIRCNWNSPCEEFTGIATVPPPGGLAGNFEPTLNVLPGEQYVICFSNWSSALTMVPLVFFGTASIQCSVLPVEILDFTGRRMDSYNELKWSTGSEVNSSHFLVERSANGTDFEGIGLVNAAGNSLEVTSYEYEDRNASPDATVYYRLKQFDVQGAYQYSEVIAINPAAQKEFSVISSFPNPAENQFNIELMLKQNDEIEFEVRDIYGKMVQSFSKDLRAGTNRVEIPISDLATGIYSITMRNKRSRESEVVKLNKS